jgi:DNA-binding FrmR family transcriptional regulator
MAVAVRRGPRVDRHAADRIERVHGGRRVVVCGLSHIRYLATNTLGGYIAAMQTYAKASVRKRLQRIEGQVRGLARMVEQDRYCIDVVTQISAVRAALRAVEDEILRDHVDHCVEHAIAGGNKAEQRRKVAELMDVLGRSAR